MIGHHFQGQQVKGQIAGGGAYCSGLPHSLLTVLCKCRCDPALYFCHYPTIILWASNPSLISLNHSLNAKHIHSQKTLPFLCPNSQSNRVSSQSVHGSCEETSRAVQSRKWHKVPFCLRSRRVPPYERPCVAGSQDMLSVTRCHAPTYINPFYFLKINSINCTKNIKLVLAFDRYGHQTLSPTCHKGYDRSFVRSTFVLWSSRLNVHMRPSAVAIVRLKIANVPIVS